MVCALYPSIVFALVPTIWLVGACLSKKKTEATRRTSKSVKLADETSGSLKKTQESRRDRRVDLVHLTPRTSTNTPKGQNTKDYAQRRRSSNTRKPEPSGRREVARSLSNVSHTAKRTTSSGKQGGTKKSVTGKVLHRASPRRVSLLTRRTSTVKRSKKKKEKQRKKLDLSDDDTETEDSEATRRRMTFPQDPYNVRNFPSYVAPDGRVIKPKVEPLSGKEEQIAVRQEFKRSTEYPTMEDVKSMWDTVEDKDKKPTPHSSDTPSFSMKTMHETRESAESIVIPGHGCAPKSSVEVEDC